VGTPFFLGFYPYSTPTDGQFRANSADQNVLAFFKLHKDLLPAIAGVVCDLALIPSSSAACERVFSLLRNMFGDKQYASLQDYIATSVKLASNKRSTLSKEARLL
jgi:hypothetical protein